MAIAEQVATLLARVRSPGFLRDVVAVSSGSLGSQAIVVLLSPILMRIYSPAEVGVQALCLSLLVVGVVGSLRYNQSIPLPKQDVDAMLLVVASFLAIFATTSCVALGVYFYGPVLFEITGATAVQGYLWLILVLFLMMGTLDVLLSTAVRFQLFGCLGKAQVTQSSVQMAYQIGAGFLGDPTAKHLLLGVLVGNIASLIVYAYSVSKTIDRELLKETSNRIHELRRNVAVYWRFPLLAAPSALVNASSVQITPLLLAAFYSTQVVGWFALAIRVVGLPITTIGYGVSQVFFQRSAQLQHQSPGQLLTLYKKTARGLLLVAIVPIGLLMLTGPFLFAIVFGEEWRESGRYIVALAPMLICQFVISPLSQIMAVINAQRTQLLWDVSRFVMVVCTICLCGELDLSPFLSVLSYSLVMTLSYIWLYWLTLSRLTRNADVA